MRTEALRQVTDPLRKLLPLGKETDPSELQATVLDLISPNGVGYVKFQGSVWRAYCKHQISLEPGTLVRVTDRQKLTLTVEPISRHAAQFKLTTDLKVTP